MKKTIRSNLSEQNEERRAQEIDRAHRHFANSRHMSTLTNSAARRSAAPNMEWRVRPTPGAVGTDLLWSAKNRLGGTRHGSILLG